MSEQQKQSLCPRLIDYLAIVGARSGTVQRTSGSNNNQPPVQVSHSQDYYSFFVVGGSGCFSRADINEKRVR